VWRSTALQIRRWLQAYPREPRRRHSWIVDSAAPTLAAIRRGLSPVDRSRETSRIFRMDNLSCATLDPLLLAKGIDDSRGCPASLDDHQITLFWVTDIT